MKNIIFLYSLLFCFTFCACSEGSDDVIEINRIGGYYYFINETTRDTLLYEAGQENVLEARNGDRLGLMYKSLWPSDVVSYPCRMTFLSVYDGTKHVKDGTIDEDISYEFTLSNYLSGRKTFFIIPEITDKRVKCTVGDKIVIFHLSVVE